jgi:tRNA threonylcarbamoyladenosine biosynthesis protein TsaE
MTYQISSDSLDVTEHIATTLGSKLRGGEVIALSSDLGGGKTAFVRGLARGMGSDDHVASPTFTIGRQYHAAQTGLTLHHFDFYRLQDPGLMSLELGEVLGDPSAVVAIEWGDVVEDILPAGKLVITIARTGKNSRELVFTYPEDLAYLASHISKVGDISDELGRTAA